jgi:hypothetical protein
MREIGSIHEGDRRVPLFAGKLWLHPNRPGNREIMRPAKAHSLTLAEGIAVYPGATYPRLPLLGLRALVQNRLKLTIDEDRVFLRTRRKWWFS